VERIVIRFLNTSFSYEKDERTLHSLNLEIHPGLTLLLGPNGCGKSTLLKLASGVEMPDSGVVSIGGHDLWKNEVEARKNLAYLPEHPDLTPYATIKEILDLVCRLRGVSLAQRDKALEFFGLQHLARRTVRELSMGQRRRAVFSACLIGTPRDVLLDEPLEGMDRYIQKKILDWIKKRTESRATVVVVSHSIEPFVQLASEAVTIQAGRAFRLKGLPADLDKKLSFLEQVAEGGLAL
jgi:ABC-2 type transport system ATP-binding protein